MTGYKFLISFIIALGLIFLASAITITEDPTNPPDGTTTSNSSIVFNYNITTDYMNSTTWSWDGTNYSLYDSSLVLFYNFDNRSALGENDTIVKDLSMYGNNGTVVGGSNISWTPNGKYNGAFNWVKNFSYIVSSFNINLTKNFTLSAWIYPTSYAGGGIVGKWNGKGQMLQLNTDGYIKFFCNGTSSFWNYSNIFSLNTWHHIVGSVNQTGQMIYLDGILKDYDANSGGCDVNNLNLSVGSYNVLGNNPFNGSIDEVMIFNRSLSANEVSQIYKTNCFKYNSTDSQCNFNQSLTSGLNSTNPTDTFNYYLCSSNSTTETCSTQRTITQTIPNQVLTANFTNSIGNVRSDFYGANTHGIWLQEGATVNNGSTQPSNLTWHRETWLNGGYAYSREDASLQSYYEGIINTGFEDWLNTSVVNVSLSNSYELANGWTANSYSGGLGWAHRTTDAHSGSYALQVNSTSGIVYFNPQAYKRLTPNKTYNASIWVKGNGGIAVTWMYQGGTTTNTTSVTLTSSWQQVSVLITPNSTQTNAWRYYWDLETGENVTIDDFSITENGVPVNWWRYGNLTNKTNEYIWANENGVRILAILSYMPSFLANRSSNCVDNSSDTDDGDCAPVDYDMFGQLSKDYVNRTTNDGQYLNVVDYEVWNEPDISFWLDNYINGAQGKADAYNLLYNATKTALKNAYPNICVGGPVITYINRTNISYSWASNFSDGCFFSLHRYISPLEDNYIASDIVGTRDIYQETKSNFDTTVNICNTYGANCSRMILSEFNLDHGSTDDLIRNTSSRANEYGMYYSLFYASALNSYPANISMITYQWADSVIYGASYPEYPHQWYSVQEPTLGLEYKPPYLVTSNFSNLCPAGATVYTSSSDDSNIKTVTCKKGNSYSVIVINTDTSSKNVSLDLSGSEVTKLLDYENGDFYGVDSNNISQLGILDSYDILYLQGEHSGVAGNVLHLKLNDGSGTTAYDISDETNDGTVSGATWDNDGINLSLILNTDYSLVSTLFTLINPDLDWDLLNLVYGYEIYDTRTSEGLGSFADFIPIIIIAIVIGLVVLLLSKAFGGGGRER